MIKQRKLYMRIHQFAYNYFHLLYYKYHKIKSNYGGSYIDSPDWIKKSPTVNPINKKDKKCFQQAVTIALYHEKIKNDPVRITKIKPFINKITGREQIFHQKK